jgi:hypothetical protein
MVLVMVLVLLCRLSNMYFYWLSAFSFLFVVPTVMFSSFLLLQNSIGGMTRTELAAFRNTLIVFQIVLERGDFEYISKIYYFSIFLHIYRTENGIGDRPAEEHFKITKTSIDSSLDLELEASIFAKKI